MHHLMAKFWWIVALRGVLGILLALAAFWRLAVLESHSNNLFGLDLFANLASIVATFVLLLGFYVFLDGLCALLLGAQDYGDGRRWWAMILEGILSMGLGLLTFSWPQDTILVALYWVAGWAIATGFLEIYQGFDLNEYKERRMPLLLAGLSSVIFGLLVFNVRIRGIGLIWSLGAYALLFGSFLLILAFRLRHFAKTRK
jgi:uncharacterized membrane protein HdeD (DUF308 family)